MNYFKLISVSLLLILTACQSDLDTLTVASHDSQSVYATSSSTTISPEDAIQQALAFTTSMKKVTRSAEFDKQVSSVYAWRSSEIYSNDVTRSATTSALPDTLLYIVNFEANSGYALVSASTKVPGVVAYIENGSLSPDEEIDNPGFRLFLDGYRDYVITDSIVGPVGPFFPEYNHLFEVEYSSGPLLTTNWGQGRPYNNECFTDSGAQARAGCVAIAIGQICGYHRYPYNTSTTGSYVDWDLIMTYEQVPPSNPYASLYIASFIHDIGILVDMEYGESSSSATFDNVEDAWYSYDYNYQKEYSADFDSIKVDISNRHPVFMIGFREYLDNDGELHRSGHAWVVDGVAIKSMYLEHFPLDNGPVTVEKITQNLVHCNWGWNGSNNGYFIIGAFENRYNLNDDGIETGFRPYNINNYVYRNIYPLDY